MELLNYFSQELVITTSTSLYKGKHSPDLAVSEDFAAKLNSQFISPSVQNYKFSDTFQSENVLSHYQTSKEQ